MRLSDVQFEFWRALLAPFSDNELSKVPARGSSKELTYVDKRAIENRLDFVCGPHNWFPEYEATARGYKCRLSIRVPEDDGSWAWLAKEDGAGFEEMGHVNKETREFEYDVDNDEKSGYTNALRRAAQDAWGIGRYIYPKGGPFWLARYFDTYGENGPSAPAAPPSGVNSDRRVEPPAHRAASPPPPPATPAPPQGQSASFSIPRAGKVFGWARDMEKTFETKIIDGMGNEADGRGWGKKLNEWTQDQVDLIALGAISFIKSLPSYKGQFDGFDTELPAETAPAPAPAPADRHALQNMAEAKRELATKLGAHIEKQTGVKPESRHLGAAFATICQQAANGAGMTGQTAPSLNSVTDLAWVRNMIRIVDEQLRLAAQAGTAEDEDIPF